MNLKKANFIFNFHMTDLYKISKFLKTLGIKNINSNKKDTFIENKKFPLRSLKV